MRTKALLLAGGLGTRLRPLTETVPKCLVPIAGKPMLSYWLDALERAGIGTALVNTHHLRDTVRAYIETENARRAVTLREAWEPDLLGSAGTVRANRGFADDADAVVVIYADNLSAIDLADLAAFHAGHDDPMTMALFRTPAPRNCGIATLDGAGRVVDFVEKPGEPASDLANAGLYVLDAEAWREIADMGAFDFGFDVLPRFVGRMRGYAFDGYHRDIGTPEALAQAEADMAAGRVR
ncbi:mannose-1-phosphate guanylyltransferase [Rhodovulum sp. ES.010]|uniref:nucleotidyltransferase family protein n=1 Tax=Rhodovulum sp. ES.010 TaxID=1882821 RepID=UPI0009262789|nr:nucleotidyltransferase family protein [Rhodovulum sp. ES.010]SIO59902.1 mannose-1-phosphate guanylyltransferase [Rhodovulum sp. ES.010]